MGYRLSYRVLVSFGIFFMTFVSRLALGGPPSLLSSGYHCTLSLGKSCWSMKLITYSILHPRSQYTFPGLRLGHRYSFTLQSLPVPNSRIVNTVYRSIGSTSLFVVYLMTLFNLWRLISVNDLLVGVSWNQLPITLLFVISCVSNSLNPVW
jgi:hypothetical protein